MTKFTPGPWYPGHLGDEGTCQCRTIVCEGLAGGIASVHVNNGIASISDGGNECPPKDEAVANMHLISSAPDMYEALKRLVEYYKGTTIEDDYALIIDQARAALSKAEGGT